MRPVVCSAAHWRRALLHGLCGLTLIVGTSASLTASAPASAQSIRDAVDAAWARSVAGRSADARALESRAKVDAADRWFAEPPAISIVQRTDRFNSNTGSRENEVDLALPIRPFGARTAERALAADERDAVEAALRHAKWKLAGEVREAIWAHRFAALELQQQKRRVADAETLAADVQRRVTAGELARVDANRAGGERDAALIAEAEAEQRARQASDAFTLLTGLKPGEPVAETPTSVAWRDDTRAAHPLVASHRLAATVAQAKTRQVAADNRDPLELTIGTVRERDAFGGAEKGSARIGIRIPLATSSRNAPRIAEANTARIESDAALQLATEQVDAEWRAASDALARVTAQVPIAERRAAAARDTATLLAKSYQLGETDLPTRLRADAERFEAERAAERVKLERARTVSRLNQAQGLLP